MALKGITLAFRITNMPEVMERAEELADLGLIRQTRAGVTLMDAKAAREIHEMMQVERVRE